METQTRPVTPPESTVLIRPARADDIPQIARLIEPFVQEGLLLRRTYDELDELLPHFFVAVTDEGDDLGAGRIIGCAALEIYSPKLAEIRSLAVSAEAQGRGVGKKLVEACIQRAREHGIFEVMAITASEGFFQSCGFDYTLPNLKRALFYQTREEY